MLILYGSKALSSPRHNNLDSEKLVYSSWVEGKGRSEVQQGNHTKEPEARFYLLQVLLPGPLAKPGMLTQPLSGPAGRQTQDLAKVAANGVVRGGQPLTGARGVLAKNTLRVGAGKKETFAKLWGTNRQSVGKDYIL